MAITEIGEAIDVGAIFSMNRAVPVWFRWKGQKIDIIQVTKTWPVKDNTDTILHFSASCTGGEYELSFNQRTLAWRLENISQEGA
jgi:hypothetical protein